MHHLTFTTLHSPPLDPDNKPLWIAGTGSTYEVLKRSLMLVRLSQRVLGRTVLSERWAENHRALHTARAVILLAVSAGWCTLKLHADP